MHPVQKHLMDTDFRDLAGTRIEGTIALSDELINLGLMEVLAQLKTMGAASTITAPTEAAATRATVEAEPSVDPKALLKNLQIDQLEYRTEAGKTVLEIKAGFGA